MHVAALQGHLEVVALLLEHPGIDVSAASNNGRTALHMAASLGHLEVVAVLLEHPGVDVSAATNMGLTALHLAALQGRLETVKLLLEHPGVDVRATSNDGETALHLAALHGHDGIVALLLGHPGIEVGATNRAGNSALHYLAMNWPAANPDVLRRLLTSPDTDPNLKNHMGDSPLMMLLRWAIMDSHLRTLIMDQLRIFMECDRVDLELKDQEGRSLEDLTR